MVITKIEMFSKRFSLLEVDICIISHKKMDDIKILVPVIGCEH